MVVDTGRVIGLAHVRVIVKWNLEPYERLLHDVMMGDRTLFTTSKAIERIWEVSQPLLEDPPPVRRYEPGLWGPEDSSELIAPDRWHLPGHPV